MSTEIHTLLAKFRPTSRFPVRVLIEHDEWLEWKKERIAKVRAWQKKRGGRHA